ncbi:MAG: alpha/beta hydrolase [Ardenticatenaceae bacterium]|nr:alpha/beta hydrolase [Ardenticatenaceae bacterium]
MTTLHAELKRPSWLLLAMEPRALYELGAYYLTLPFLKAAPAGDGHPVMVLPGFMADDLSTRPLRNFLKGKGYKTYGWAMGRNFGQGTDLESGGLNYRLMERLRAISAINGGKKVSLVGWSLGGIYAREMAREQPELVRQVISLGSPFVDAGVATYAKPLYELLRGESVHELHPKLKERLKIPPPVPSTAVYSRTDGIAAWQSCLDQTTDEQTENIEVDSSHCGLGHNPLVVWVIADRLAQPEGEWRPFDRSGLRRLFYRGGRDDGRRTTDDG